MSVVDVILSNCGIRYVRSGVQSERRPGEPVGSPEEGETGEREGRFSDHGRPRDQDPETTQPQEHRESARGRHGQARRARFQKGKFASLARFDSNKDGFVILERTRDPSTWSSSTWITI